MVFHSYLNNSQNLIQKYKKQGIVISNKKYKEINKKQNRSIHSFNGDINIQERLNILTLAIKNSRIGIWDWNVQTDEIFYFSDYSFITESIDLIATGKDWKAIIHPDDFQGAMQLLNAHVEGLIPHYEAEYRIEIGPGVWKWILDKGKVIKWDKNGKGVRVVGTHQDITKRKKAELKLEDSLKEKNILLKEIHHRFKNNLQIISGLAILHEKYIEDIYTLMLFNDFQNRIKVMAEIHETIYNSDDLTKINGNDYINRIIGYLKQTYADKMDSIIINLDLDKIDLKINKSMHIGLIINELISNCLKYAFPDEKGGKIWVKMKEKKSGHLEIIVEDNGIGLPKDLNINEVQSLGIKIVNTSVKQLKGTLQITSMNGTTVHIIFPNEVIHNDN